jgi:hypothetical protein
MAGWRSPCKSVISQSWRPTFPGWREVRRQRESDSISEILCWTRKSVSAWDALMNSNKTPSNNHTKIIGESVVRAGNFELPPHSRAKSQYPPRPLPTVAHYSLLSGFLPRPRDGHWSHPDPLGFGRMKSPILSTEPRQSSESFLISCIPHSTIPYPPKGPPVRYQSSDFAASP